MLSEKWLGSRGWYHGTGETVARSDSITICLAEQHMQNGNILSKNLVQQNSYAGLVSMKFKEIRDSDLHTKHLAEVEFIQTFKTNECTL